MKKLVCFIVTILIVGSSIAQVDSTRNVVKSLVKVPEHPMLWNNLPYGPEVIYYPFYNGIQMVEVDYYNHGLRVGSFQDAINPRGGSSYGDALQWPARNAYYFIDTKGTIIKEFGDSSQLHGVEFDLDSRRTLITHKERFEQAKIVDGSHFLNAQGATCGMEYGPLYPVYEQYASRYFSTQGTKQGLMDTLGFVKIPMLMLL